MKKSNSLVKISLSEVGVNPKSELVNKKKKFLESTLDPISHKTIGDTLKEYMHEGIVSGVEHLKSKQLTNQNTNAQTNEIIINTQFLFEQKEKVSVERDRELIGLVDDKYNLEIKQRRLELIDQLKSFMDNHGLELVIEKYPLVFDKYIQLLSIE